ncbi:MAG: hypothetical protein GQ537_10395, partial [Gammaproteobacteria bacterium]|nr:hypothetical protein [Gammaproteobacteria bacterium]
VKQAESETEADDPVSRFDLDFSIMALELAEFIPSLLAALGGEELPDGMQARSVATKSAVTGDRVAAVAEPA